MPQNNRLIWLDALRLTAGVSMIGLHATADSTGQPWVDFTMAERAGPMLLRAVIYTARTELFLIISVFLLLMAQDRTPQSYGATMAQQARRLLIPFLFWTVFYAFFTLIKAGVFGYHNTLLALLTCPQTWADYLLLGGSKYHMHFIPTLFGLLLMFPLFKLATKMPALGLVVLICLVSKREIDSFLWTTFYAADWLPFALRTAKILTYAGYGMVAGAAYGLWSAAREGRLAQWVPLLGYLGGLLFAIKLIATYKTVQSGAWPYTYTPAYYADFLMPVLLFAAAMALGHKRWPTLLSRIAPYSFGIYLCHPIFLDVFEIILRGQNLTPMTQVCIKIAGAALLTSLLVRALARFRPLAWTIGMGPLPGLTKREKRKVSHAV